ncbi:thiamine-phosphate kinase [Croceicoccus pelagius]|uniref:Thiamine-monophosphate kinase n=1 Tax=Croceicoccus pelagius TaxID=1703341 RepID=A0A916YKU7_9SPHN|nr:thiamine-phosphate kinase [Croceicoccus pelagius]GGD49395.1 thiamine-monophosphate kinase [Croceicoccus pelagius]
MRESGEERFIAALRAIATSPGARGLADDAAELRLTNTTLVVTHDMMVEGVHWLPEQDAADVAYKLVAVNLSDLAAKGAMPQALLLGYMLGDADWDARFAQGLADAVEAFGVPLLGGDTVSTPAGSARSVGLTAIGRPAVVPAPSRTDARPGQALWVTGELGGALAGFEAMQAGSADAALTRPFRRPDPRIEEGLAIAPMAGATMDVSDGLLLDAARMAEASGTTIAIDSAAVPVCAALADRRIDAMTWGDDYELLFTLPESKEPSFAATRIGTVLPRGDHRLLLDGEPPATQTRLGYRHG